MRNNQRKKAYEVLQRSREKFGSKLGFFKASERLNMTPRELSILFHHGRIMDKNEEMTKEGQLTMFGE